MDVSTGFGIVDSAVTNGTTSTNAPNISDTATALTELAISPTTSRSTSSNP